MIKLLQSRLIPKANKLGEPRIESGKNWQDQEIDTSCHRTGKDVITKYLEAQQPAQNDLIHLSKNDGHHCNATQSGCETPRSAKELALKARDSLEVRQTAP